VGGGSLVDPCDLGPIPGVGRRGNPPRSHHIAGQPRRVTAGWPPRQTPLQQAWRPGRAFFVGHRGLASGAGPLTWAKPHPPHGRVGRGSSSAFRRGTRRTRARSARNPAPKHRVRARGAEAPGPPPGRCQSTRRGTAWPRPARQRRRVGPVPAPAAVGGPPRRAGQPPSSVLVCMNLRRSSSLTANPTVLPASAELLRVSFRLLSPR